MGQAFFGAWLVPLLHVGLTEATSGIQMEDWWVWDDPGQLHSHVVHCGRGVAGRLALAGNVHQSFYTLQQDSLGEVGLLTWQLRGPRDREF